MTSVRFRAAHDNVAQTSAMHVSVADLVRAVHALHHHLAHDSVAQLLEAKDASDQQLVCSHTPGQHVILAPPARHVPVVALYHVRAPFAVDVNSLARAVERSAAKVLFVLSSSFSVTCMLLCRSSRAATT